MTGSDHDPDQRRRRARFRAWHRGLRELDLLMGGFADSHIDGLGEADLAAFEALLREPDSDVLKWITGEAEVPSVHDTPLFARLIASRSRNIDLP